MKIDTVWIVETPRPTSEIVDILWPASFTHPSPKGIFNVGLVAAGRSMAGLSPAFNVDSVWTDEGQARTRAISLLRELTHTHTCPHCGSTWRCRSRISVARDAYCSTKCKAKACGPEPEEKETLPPAA